MKKMSISTMKIISNVKVCRLDKESIVECANNAIIRAIYGKALGRKYDKTTGNLINIQSYVESIPFHDRFNHFDKDIVEFEMSNYRYEHSFIDWESQNVTKIYKGKEYNVDKRKQVSLLNNIDNNLKNECYLYIYKMIGRMYKFDKIKAKLLKIKNEKILSYYNLLKGDKDFNTFLKNITFYDIKTGDNQVSSKEHVENVLVFKLAFIFSRLMLDAYRERAYSTYKQRKYKIEVESLSFYDDDVNTIASECKYFDNIEVYDKLVRSLSESELKILNDIKNGMKYVDIQEKYHISSKTIAKLKVKVISLFNKDYNRKNKKVLTNEAMNVSKLVEERNKMESEGIKVDNRFEFENHMSNRLSVKEDFVGNLNKKSKEELLKDMND